jgi:minor extracellular serine protease Vpr
MKRFTFKHNCQHTSGCTFKMTKHLFYLIVVFVQFPAFAQTRVATFKIDPVYRFLIDAANTKTSKISDLPAFVKRVQPTKGFSFPNSNIEERYECVVYTRNAKELSDSGIIINSTLPTFVTAWATLDQISKMAAMPQVLYIEAPQTLHKVNDLVVGSSGASLLHQKKLNNTVYKGKNVLVAIFDSGIDWKHLDFRSADDTTESRILRIWDQTITATPGEAPPAGFSYGVEYTQTQINNEIDGTPANVVREKDTDGHGTHVAGTAVGNGQALPSKKYMGMAPESDIIIIKGGDSTFDDNRIIDALTYLKTLSTNLGKPVVLNLSSGSLFGAHDGTRPVEQAIDNFTASAPGRAVAVSAGNDGGTNKHNQLNIGANLSASVTFNAPTMTSGTDVFSYVIYANANAATNATLTTPGGGSVTALAGQSMSGSILNNNFTVFLTNGIDNNNNNRFIQVRVERSGSNTSSPEGTYSLNLTNVTATSLKMDGWLYKINSAFKPTVLENGDNDYLVSSPGNAASAITVASYVARNAWYTAYNTSLGYTKEREDSISSFSSRGPRRDNVLKPEISSDGQGVISSLSSTKSKVDSGTVIEKGLYFLNQGTSMATPGVAGAVALLLQASSAATASQLKTLITSTATKGGMTELAGPTPNTTWGYGKLDVFKAASLLFNCGPAERRTYKYDSSTRNSEQTGFKRTTERIGVRFTPDISGKLGGVYYQTLGLSTGIIIEIRSSDAGNPGALLGTLSVPSNLIQRYSWNYYDVSTLNVTVTNGVDYFVVIYRDPASSEDWSIGAERLLVDNRSVNSTNSGSAWSIVNADFKIRSVVYNNVQLSGAIATTTSADTKNIISSSQFVNANCQLIAQVIPAGLNPVAGTVTSRVWIEGSVPHASSLPFVQRHYQITPAVGTAATATVTLYFTQAEFSAYNSDAASTLNLPANPADVAGKANLRIVNYSGISSDNTGLPGSYSGSAIIIDPADSDIVWNAELNRWEVTFTATGFGGFVVQTKTATVNPNLIEYFRGITQGAANVLSWKVNCTGSNTTFDVERSSNGIDFNSIGTINSSLDRCLQPFTFEDPSPFNGNNYYRLKVTGSGASVYSDLVQLQNSSQPVTRLYPTLFSRGSSVSVRFTGTKGSLAIYDAIGRQVFTRALINGLQSVSVKLPSSGVYFYTIRDDNTVIVTDKIVVQ